MRAALIANRTESDPGFVGDSLRARGYEFVPLLREEHAEWPDPTGFDLVVSLGSGWSTYWPDVAELVVAEQGLMAAAIAAEVPVLGLCFGAQQMATVLGGKVTKAQSHEIGWFSVEMTAESAGIVPSGLLDGPWMQWHYDRFTVPTTAVCLAESPVGPQAFVAGRCLGLQFHPEATEQVVAGWASGAGEKELHDAGISPADLIARTRDLSTGSRGRCDALVEWFVTRVAQGHIRKP